MKPSVDGFRGGSQAALRGPLQLCVDRVFGPYFAGSLMSMIGVWMYNIVAAIAVFDASHSVGMVSLVTIALFSPQLCFGALSGAFADRTNRRWLMVAGQGCLIVGSATSALVVWAGVVYSMWVVVGSALLLGVGFTLSGPAQQAVLPGLVRPGELASAVVLGSFPMMIARAVGPSMGGILVVKYGAASAFALAGVLQSGFLLILIWLPIPVGALRGRAADSTLRSGLRYVKERHALQYLLVAVFVIGWATDPTITLAPSIANNLGGGSELVGLFASTFGVAAAASLPLLVLVRRRVAMSVCGLSGLGLLGGSSALIAVSRGVAPTLVGFTLGGAGFTIAFVSLRTLLQLLVDDLMRGRIMGLAGVAFLGARPLAAAVDGSLSSASSVPVALFAIGALVLAILVWGTRVPGLGDAVDLESTVPMGRPC